MAHQITPLTESEIDDFARRLKATVAVASQHRALVERLSQLLGGSARVRALTRGVARPQGGVDKGGAALVEAAQKRGGRRPALDDEAVFDAIRRAPAGAAAGDLQRHFGASPFQVKGVIQRLRSSNRIRITGSKRGTRYFVSGAAGSTAPSRGAASKRTGAARKKSRDKAEAVAGGATEAGAAK